MHKLSLHQGLSPERTTLLVTVKVAHRALKRYFNGEVDNLKSLNSQILQWLEERNYVEAVLDGNELHFIPTRKAERAFLA